MSSQAEPEITETYHIFLASPGDMKDTADISCEQLFQTFDPMLEKLLCREDLLGFLQQHTGTLIACGQDHFAFPHRSFQEYLAMGWLTEQNDDVLSPEVCDDPDAIQPSGTFQRVVRGGSWLGFRDIARVESLRPLLPGLPHQRYRFSGVLFVPHLNSDSWVS
ncbi:MAG: hypothetical protein V3U75_09385 [Methylococcaceae bacterium]